MALAAAVAAGAGHAPDAGALEPLGDIARKVEVEMAGPVCRRAEVARVRRRHGEETLAEFRTDFVRVLSDAGTDGG